MDLSQFLYALSAAASTVSGSVLLLGVAAYIVTRAFLPDMAGHTR